MSAFRSAGHVVVPSFLEPSELALLRRACDVALDAARAASETAGHSTPRLSLTDASLFRAEPRAFASVLGFAASPQVAALLVAIDPGAEQPTPRLERLDYYHEQTRRDWDGDWHRDGQFGRADPDVERQAPASTMSVHVRVALVDDDCLEIVPGSHGRWDTDEELRIRRGPRRASEAMSGSERVALRAGDASLFHAGTIHRATYRRRPLRRTIDLLYHLGPPQRAPSSWPR